MLHIQIEYEVLFLLVFKLVCLIILWIQIEVERGDVASGIECYMNEYGATKEEAYMEIRKIIENNWKDLNRGCLKPTTVPRVLLMPVLNLTRVAEFFYKDEDAYTFSKNNLKDVISMVLIDPIKA